MRIATLTLNPSVDLTLSVDALVKDDVLRAEEVCRHPGGKGLNVAGVLKTLGCPARAIALLGGTTGTLVADLARKAGLVLDVVPVTNETRTNLTLIERRVAGVTKINTAGPQVLPQEQQRLLHHLDQICAEIDTLVLSGSLPPGLPEDIYATIIRRCAAQGVRCILDADGVSLQAGIGAGPYLVKPNLHELVRWAREDLETYAQRITAARRILTAGVSLVLLSLGQQGAWLVTTEQIWSAVPPPVPVVSTVGCGDALLAGFLWGLMLGEALEEALRRAVATGTAMATTPGTELCRLEQVLPLVARTQVTRLEPPA